MCRSSSNHQTTGRHDLGTLGALASKVRSTRRRDEKNEKAGAGSESDVGGDAMEEGYKALGPKVQQFKRSVDQGSGSTAPPSCWASRGEGSLRLAMARAVQIVQASGGRNFMNE